MEPEPELELLGALDTQMEERLSVMENFVEAVDALDNLEEGKSRYLEPPSLLQL